MDRPLLHQLNKNENNFGHHPEFNSTLSHALELNLGSYPANSNQNFYQSLADFHAVSLSSLFIDNGLENAIHTLFLAAKANLGVKQICFFDLCWPTYQLLSHECSFSKSDTITYPALPHSLAIDLNQLKLILLAQKDPLLVVITNPNNPTGLSLPFSQIKKLCLEFPQHYFFIDEAYVGFKGHFYRHTHSLKFSQTVKNVIVGRSFSKFFATPGIRIGYLVAHPELISSLHLVPHHLGINQISQNIAQDLLQNYSFYLKQAQEIIHIRRHLSLLEYSTFSILPSQTNFVLLQVHSNFDSQQLNQYLIEHGYLVKFFEADPIKNHLRITLAPLPILLPFLDLLQLFLEKA